MDDETTTAEPYTAPKPPLPPAWAKLRPLEQLLWWWIVILSFVTGIIGGNTLRAGDASIGADSFGWGAFFGWALLAFASCIPWLVIFYAIRHVLDQVMGREAVSHDGTLAE